MKLPTVTGTVGLSPVAHSAYEHGTPVIPKPAMRGCGKSVQRPSAGNFLVRCGLEASTEGGILEPKDSHEPCLDLCGVSPRELRGE